LATRPGDKIVPDALINLPTMERERLQDLLII
jgi:hypothetical protein